MFNAEKLLGKLIGDVVSTNHGSYGKGKRSVLGNLTSGAGLMTIIGLGVGAYEIFKEQGMQRQGGPNQMAPPPPPPGGGGALPLSGRGQASPPPPPMSSEAGRNGRVSTEELAVRLIRVMIAAAHADGTMDEEEERAVLERLRGAELSAEEKMFLVEELHQPKSIEILTAGIDDPAVAKTMYMLAVAGITVDSEAERAWLNQLAQQLGLSRELQNFIEEQR